MNTIQSPISVAISRVLAAVEVRRWEMSRSLDKDRVAQLLLAQAASARRSPLGHHQLLALALEAAASTGDLEAPGLDALRERPDPLEQLELRRRVFAQVDPAMAAVVARAAPGWVLNLAGKRVRRDPQLAAARMRDAADLNAALWDHPALPADPAMRALMLACTGALRENAQLAPSAARAQDAPQTWRGVRQGAPA